MWMLECTCAYDPRPHPSPHPHPHPHPHPPSPGTALTATLTWPTSPDGQPLLAALLLALRQAEPLCGVAAEVLCDAMQVGSYPDTQNAPILAGLLRDVLLGAPYCLGEQAAEGSTLAVARVLGAAVCAAPEVVEGMEAAGGGEGERLRGLLLSLSSQPDRRCLEELAAAWAALTPLHAASGHTASWRQLAEVPATPRARGCNPTCSRLQPHVPCARGCNPTCHVLEAATPCARGCNPTHSKPRAHSLEAAALCT